MLNRTIALLLLTTVLSCNRPTEPEGSERSRRADMVRLIADLGDYARHQQPGFEIILQNGHEVLFVDGTASSAPMPELLSVVTGVARESMQYGFDADDEKTPPAARGDMLRLAQGAAAAGLTVLTVDYCSTPAHMDSAYAGAQELGFVPFAAPRRELDAVPAYPALPFRQHEGAVDSLHQVRNFLYLINPANYTDGEDLARQLSQTTYDLLIIDAFVEQHLTRAQVESLQRKPNGARRLVVAYLSIGEAEVYRDYFEGEWIANPPAWLAAENPQWRGNYKVRFWDPEWQAILFGSPGASLDRIIAAGFDGVYLDIVDAFEYFDAGGS